jgi:DNA-binding transcriptional LysR family regulator
MSDDLEGVAAFVRVVRAGSFSAAAREDGLNPSAVSKRIARLEARLGIALFSRTTRKLVLTEAGQEMYDRCAVSLAGIVDAIEIVSRFRQSPQGVLRVRVPQAFGRLHIGPAIPAFLRRYPDIQLELAFGQTERAFMEQRLDVLVGSADPPNIRLSVRNLVALERVTCVAPTYLEHHERPCTFADLARHNCLLFTASDSVENEWVLRGENGVARVRIAGNFRTDDAEAIYQAVLGGVGIAHMPSFIVGPAIAAGRLIALFQDAPGKDGAMMKAYYPEAKHRLPKVAAFLDFLSDLFKPRKA